MDITTKAPKYDAKAGQVIAGNLARGGDGKFTRADGSAASGRDVVNALTKRPKAGKGKKASTVSPAAQDALASKVGLQSGDSAALQQFAKGGTLDPATAQRLQQSGLVETGKDGTVRFSDTGRSVTRALAKGDERSAADAMSRAKDRAGAKQDAEAKKAQRQTERDARRAESQSRRDAAQAERDKRNAGREQAKADKAGKAQGRELTAVNDRLEEIDALTKADKNITEPERVRRNNQLDKLEKRLSDAGGDTATQAKIDSLRKSLAPGASAGGASSPASPAAPALALITPAAKPAKPRASRSKYRELSEIADVVTSAGALSVFKAGDTWRWLGISSNAYQDRESEIVSTEALERDAERMAASGEYGPLRWWHVGNIEIPNPLDFTSVKAGPGADIGSCDYSVTLGRMALEGGEIYSPEIAAKLAEEPGAWQMSRGFAHPPTEPASGIYTQIKTFERSLLPAGRAANPFTTVSATKEAPDMATIQEKMKALADKFFAGDEKKAGEIFAAVTATDKEIADSGVAFKAVEPPADAEPTAETPAEPAPVEAKADASADMAEGETPEADDSGDASAGFIGDMTPDEFVAMLAPAIAEALAAAMAPTMSELSATKSALETTQKELVELKSVKTKESETLAGAVNAINSRVKELEGDAPGGARGYRASDANPLSEAEVKAKGLTLEPQPMSELERLGAWAAKI